MEKETKVPALGEFKMMCLCVCRDGKTNVSALKPNKVVSACEQCYEDNGMVM